MEARVTSMELIVETTNALFVGGMMMMILIQVNYVVRVEGEKVKRKNMQLKSWNNIIKELKQGL